MLIIWGWVWSTLSVRKFPVFLTFPKGSRPHEKMLESRPEDALVILVKAVETAETAETARTAHTACTAHTAHAYS